MSLENKSIYLIEDDEINQLFCVGAIQFTNPEIKIKTFQDAESAQEAITKSGFPDFIVSDYNLGLGINGIEFVNWLAERGFNDFVIWSDRSEDLAKKHPEIDMFFKSELAPLREFVAAELKKS